MKKAIIIATVGLFSSTFGAPIFQDSLKGFADGIGSGLLFGNGETTEDNNQNSANESGTNSVQGSAKEARHYLSNIS